MMVSLCVIINPSKGGYVLVDFLVRDWKRLNVFKKKEA